MMSSELSSTILRLKIWTPFLQSAAGTHRKPRWLPVAKSKIYRIPRRPVVPIEEKREVMRLTNNYHTQMRALRRFYTEEMLRAKSSQLDATSEQSMQQEALDFERCMKDNDEWNAAIAKEREVRLAKEDALMQERGLARMELKDRELRERIDKANELIRKEKEASKSFITAETLDAAIEHALANPVDYNFSIDLQGNRQAGRDANSTLAGQERKEAAN